jgi:ribose transport system ATP-binding protein
MMIGKQLDQYFPEKVFSDSNESVIRVEGLTNRKVKNVSFSVGEGEIMGLFGLVGAGRSELARRFSVLTPSQAESFF